MIANVTPIVGPDVAASWERLIRGLWLGGLRLSEAMGLNWEDVPEAIVVDFSGRRPTFRIPAAAEKGNEDRVLPMAPEFATFLAETPVAERTGLVFLLDYRRKGRGR